MATSTHLLLPYLASSQAQKHVTHNEALRLLDELVQLAVVDRDRTAPPSSPADGARYLVAGGATGLWAGWDGSVAMFSDGTWVRLLPRPGWICWVEAESVALVWTGSAWTDLVSAMGLIARGAEVEVATGPAGFSTGMAVREQLISGLSGTSVEPSITVPNRGILLGVTTRVTTAITGATSFSCGIAGEATKFGSLLGIAAGSTNIGVIGPTAVYADTPVVLTAAGGAFTVGAVRIAIRFLTCAAP
ncbi:DUF2793 domain-containing protein [Amaricoccus sp. W119]|uniref:DUF2793 domain-containing protein n=1 Tax=Amaricoccus sp. W119 TaxID=3391833 RepID=UPI0039A438CC